MIRTCLLGQSIESSQILSISRVSRRLAHYMCLLVYYNGKYALFGRDQHRVGRSFSPWLHCVSVAALLGLDRMGRPACSYELAWPI